MGYVVKSLRKRCGNIVLGLYKKYLRLGGVEIGSNAFISPFAQVDLTRGTVVIGDDVTITAGTRVLSHSSIAAERHPEDRRRKKTKINDGVFIGVNSVIMPGVTVGENAVVGAGSIVTKDVTKDAVVAGNPAEPIGKQNIVDRQIGTSTTGRGSPPGERGEIVSTGSG